MRSSSVFGGVRVAELFSFLCCPINCIYVLSSVLWCLLRFAHKTMFASSFPPDVSVVSAFFAHSGVQHILSFCFVFLHFECPMFTASLVYPFLIAPSVFSNVYLLVPESEWILKTGLGICYLSGRPIIH
jgi:hypothetical protein